MTRAALCVDTSVTIAHLLRSHPQHAVVRRMLARRRLALAPHSLAENRAVHRVLAEQGVAGGAVSDALVAFAALEADVPLATRDVRAAGTYEALGVRVERIPVG